MFLGYSFSDMNMRYLLYKLHRLRSRLPLHQRRNPIAYLTVFGSNDVQRKLLKQWEVEVVELDPRDKTRSHRTVPEVAAVNIYVLTTNRFKAAELAYCRALAPDREALRRRVVRRQAGSPRDPGPDIPHIVRQKAVEAYRHMGLPCVVEHGGIYMKALPGLPGSVGKIVWDAVEDRICGFLRETDSREATVKSYLGYCDGQDVRVYEGLTKGRIADRARGRYAFAWDPIFIPGDESRTYGQMGLEGKRHSSPTYKAWDAFFAGEQKRFAALRRSGRASIRRRPRRA